MNEESSLSIKMSPTEFVAVVNQTLEYAYQNVIIEGEVGSFKINQGKWVFFDLKDAETSVSCFMPVYQLRMPLEDGMKVMVRAIPKVTKWGKFSLTVSAVKPVGEGSLKKSLAILKTKLEKEGLFSPARKRKLPEPLSVIGVISSTGAAGYADFIKIINARWGGLKIKVAHVQVQGIEAPDQMIRALKYFNEQAEVQAIVMIRGGGSADDLAAYNDEKLVREVAASRIPVVTGIGHEVDHSLVDLAADLAASTPSNAAELITKDREAEMRRVNMMTKRIFDFIMAKITETGRERERLVEKAEREIVVKITTILERLKSQRQIIENLNPEAVLKKGYAIIAGKIEVGRVVKITTLTDEIEAKLNKITPRKERI